MPTGNQRHHPFLCMSLMSYIVTQSEGMHLNSGILAASISCRRRIERSNFPAACGMRYITGMRLSDCILGAMAQALPDSVPRPARGASITVVPITTRRPAKLLAVANPVYGGSEPTHLDGFTGLDIRSHSSATFRPRSGGRDVVRVHNPVRPPAALASSRWLQCSVRYRSALPRRFGDHARATVCLSALGCMVASALPGYCC